MSVHSIKKTINTSLKKIIQKGLKKGLITLLTTCVLTPVAFAAFLMFVSLESHAKMNDEGKVLMAYTTQDFDTTLTTLRKQLVKKGFQVAHVQRCDGGLKKMGYDINKYQVVFFGRLEEVREMTTKHAALAPFLPFKLLIYVEGDKTVISIMNPEMLTPMVSDKALTAKFAQWRGEFVDILTQTTQSSLAMK